MLEKVAFPDKEKFSCSKPVLNKYKPMHLEKPTVNGNTTVKLHGLQNFREDNCLFFPVTGSPSLL